MEIKCERSYGIPVYDGLAIVSDSKTYSTKPESFVLKIIGLIKQKINHLYTTK